MANPKKPIGYKLVKGGDVPGGHNCLYDGIREPFITPMKECSSIGLRHTDVVVDIGAYVGTYAIKCARFPVKKVIAYEPTPMSFGVLSLTKLPNLETRQMAVLGNNHKTHIDFYISRGIGVTNGTIPSKLKDEKITVKAISYQEAIREATIVKIDIEGGEYDLPIIQPNLRAVIIDFHPIGKDWIDKSKYIIAELEKAGFSAVITPNFSNGWTRAGSWIREIQPQSNEVCEVLMTGKKCTGCGTELKKTGKLSLCPTCWNLWSIKHKERFILAEKTTND